jgi:hypothetical protein
MSVIIKLKGEYIKKSLKNKILIAGTAAAIGLSGVAGFSAVSAESNASDGSSSLVDKLVSKFNLNKSDVQKIFEEDRTEHEAAREKEQSEHLQKLVDAGTITASQKTAIEAKIKELKSARESSKDSMKDLTEAERKTKMEEERTNLESWAKAQGLDLTKLQGIFMGGRGHGGFGGPGGPLPASGTN